MAAEVQECQQIDIWHNNDGRDTADLLCKNLSRISPFPVYLHDIANLSDHSLYATLNGTLVVVISPDTISMLASTPSLNFSSLQTNESHRYYVDSDRLLHDHNTRVSLIGGEARWILADLECNDPKAMQSTFREIVHCTVKGADDSPNPSPNPNLTRNRPKKPSKRGKRGAFMVIPNEFQLGVKRADNGGDAPDGTLIIETSNLGWEFKGDPLTGFLIKQADTSPIKIPIEITKLVASEAYSFKLPDKLEPATYMIHLKDGKLPSDHELGNRRLRVYSSASYISENLFSEAHLAALCDIPDLSTSENCEAADRKLCEYFDKAQLPLMLFRELGKKLPTLLHVACYYGLNKLFAKIIDSFCSLDTLNIPNEDLQRPVDLAVQQNHQLLADLLSNQLMIQKIYVEQYSQYVCHDPTGDEFDDFYDIYTTVNSVDGDIDDGYVQDVRTVHANGEDPDYDIYTSVESGLPANIHRTVSLQGDRSRGAQRPPSPPASKTLPRMFASGSLFERDIPADALVSGNFKQDHATEFQGIAGMLNNGEITVGLAEKHMRDWTRRMNSLRRLGLEQRLQQQLELKSEMTENSSLLRKRAPVKEMVVPPRQADAGAITPPPRVVPRKAKKPPAPPPKGTPAPPPKGTPAPPPKGTPDPPPKGTPDPPPKETPDPLPPRRIPPLARR